MDDVIIIGGSFAGLAGALQLGRARRNVTVLDTGLPRNRSAASPNSSAPR
jgi:thioredoxin reductase